MILDFIIILIPMIILHELAHFIAAKFVTCPVDTVSLGFFKPILWQKKIGDTIYQATPWLFGGYCSLHGELENNNDPKAFANLSYSSKFILLSAGCYANIISGLIALIIDIFYPQKLINLFGYYSILIGIGNMIPFPCLDGGYLWLFWLPKFIERKLAFKIIKVLVKIGFYIIMTSNVACLLFLVWLYKENIILFVKNLIGV